MNFESIVAFLLIVAPVIIGFLIEALVIYLFKIRHFWGSIGLSLIVNLISLVLVYAGTVLISKLGYAFDGLQMPLQVVLTLWWLSTLSDGAILHYFFKGEKKRAYLCSILMNFLSYAFLYIFISLSH